MEKRNEIVYIINMKIIAKRKKNQDPIYDQKGNIIWDGKKVDIVVCEGEEKPTKFMFDNMQTYINLKEWDLKLMK